jgi:hypothetical protein
VTIQTQTLPKRGVEITGSPSPKLAYHLDPVDGGNPALRGFRQGWRVRFPPSRDITGTQWSGPLFFGL